MASTTLMAIISTLILIVKGEGKYCLTKGFR